MITYAKLWETMKEKGISQYVLIHKYNVSAGQLSRIRKNEYISTHTIEMLCRLIDCNVEDIMEFIPDSESAEGTEAQQERDSAGADSVVEIRPDFILKQGR